MLFLNSISTQIKLFFEPLFHLIYPVKCIVCDRELNTQEIEICPFCKSELPYTFFENMYEANPLQKLFWGRSKIHRAFSLLFFEKNNATMPIVHAIKYQHKSQLAIECGKLIAVKAKPLFENDFPDALIPIPLHYKRQFERGYNQSEKICHGIEKIWPTKILKNGLFRGKNITSQTKLSRFDRWSNVQSIFHVDPSIAQFKHIALVDDVVTTGATLETAIQEISKNYPEIRISIISLAIAK